MSTDEAVVMRASDITKDRAAAIVSAVYTCGNTLADLMPATRLIVLRALCATFLEEEPEVEPVPEVKP